MPGCKPWWRGGQTKHRQRCSRLACGDWHCNRLRLAAAEATHLHLLLHRQAVGPATPALPQQLGAALAGVDGAHWLRRAAPPNCMASAGSQEGR